MADGFPLELRDLVVAGDEGPILELDRLDVAPGQSLGVRGPSGAGKTTLIFALAGLVPMTGRVLWGTTDLVQLRPSQRRAFRAAHVGLVFQDFLLFEELGPASNASITALFSPRPRRTALRSRAHSLLERLGVPERSSVASLSGGERQRVAIARALIARPAIILADEPTAALHSAAADQITHDLLTQARESGGTLVVSSHDGRLLSQMDRVIELVGGARVPA